MRNLCKPKFVYFLYVALKNVFFGFPVKITFSAPYAAIFNNPPGILKYYDIVERQNTLLVLSMKKEEDWLSDEEPIEVSENLYNAWSKETGRIR